MIRVDADAVHLPSYCIEQSVRAPADEPAAPTTSSGSCFPRIGRRRPDARASTTPTLGTNTSSISSIPASRLVGAEADPLGRVRVWYTEEEEQHPHRPDPTLRGYVCPPPLRVRVTAPIDVGSTDAQADLIVSRVRALAHGRAAVSPRVIAIINPTSGRGRSLRDFERDARPLLERAAGLSVTVLPTERAGHARELAHGLDLGDGGESFVLAVVGGDGTLHEVINGLLTRADWRQAVGGSGANNNKPPRLLLCHVPCGSGNGVAVSCGLRDAATAAVAIAKGCCRAPLDVTSVLVRTVGGRLPTMVEAEETTTTTTTATLTRTFCALSVVYGMMANLDVKTEPLRFLGDARFTIGGALEILGARSYACRGACVGPPPPEGGGGGGEEDVDEQEEQYQPPPAAGEDAPLAGGRARSCDLLAAAAAEEATPAADAAATATSDLLLGDGGPPLPLLSRLIRATSSNTNQLPERIPEGRDLRAAGWRPLPIGGSGGNGGGGVHMLAAVGPPYVAGNYRFNPLGGLSTGALRQMWVPGHSVRGVGGRLKSLALQDAAAEGRHLDCGVRSGGLMRHAPAQAMALEPQARPGETWVQLDGEVVKGAVPGTALWAETHKGLLTVVVRPGHPEAEAA